MSFTESANGKRGVAVPYFAVGLWRVARWSLRACAAPVTTPSK